MSWGIRRRNEKEKWTLLVLKKKICVVVLYFSLRIQVNQPNPRHLRDFLSHGSSILSPLDDPPEVW